MKTGVEVMDNSRREEKRLKDKIVKEKGWFVPSIHGRYLNMKEKRR